MPRHIAIPHALTLGCLLFALSGCEPKTATPPETKAFSLATASPQADLDLFFKRGLLIHGSRSLEQSLESAQRLVKLSEVFLQQPELSHWQALQQHWLVSHSRWHLSDFYLQLLDDRPALQQLRLALHSETISPGYLDHINGYPHSGIVHDISLPLDADSLRQQHHRYSHQEAAIGLSVLEFFIWARPPELYRSDIAVSQTQPFNDLKEEQLPTSRRRLLLQLLTRLWLEDIDKVHRYWQQHRDSLKYKTTASINLSKQQQLSRLTNNQHSPYSHDEDWQQVVLNAAAKHSLLTMY